MPKRILILIAALFIITVLLLLLSLIKPKSSSPTPFTSPTPISIIPMSKKQISPISNIIPGKTNQVDVEKILGTPSQDSNIGNLTQLDFPTSQKNFTDTVVVKQSLTYYTVENVFDDSTYGTTEEFLSRFGTSYAKLYDTRGGYDWYVFTNQGFGIETNGSQITKLIRFSPQDLSTFLQGPGADLGLSKTQIPPVEEVNPGP